MNANPDKLASSSDDVIIKIGRAILETVAESPHPAPGGHLYLALMSVNLTFDQFNQLMGGLVRLGFLTHSNECYSITETGKAFLK